MLRYRVFAQSVTNLSDARYFAGMGVELMGFNCNPSQPRYIQPTLLEAITGWLSGVYVVAECLGMPLSEALQVAGQIGARYVLTDTTPQPQSIGSDIIPIYCIQAENPPQVITDSNALFLIQTTEADFGKHTEVLTKFAGRLIVGSCITPHNVIDYFETYKVYAVSVMGGNEDAPGLKSFDELADILEKLEDES